MPFSLFLSLDPSLPLFPSLPPSSAQNFSMSQVQISILYLFLPCLTPYFLSLPLLSSPLSLFYFLFLFLWATAVGIKRDIPIKINLEVTICEKRYSYLRLPNVCQEGHYEVVCPVCQTCIRRVPKLLIGKQPHFTKWILKFMNLITKKNMIKNVRIEQERE